MKARHIWLGLAAAAVAIACSSAPKEGPVAAPEPSPSWSAEERAYLDELADVDEGLVANEARAIRRAESTCDDIAKGFDDAKLQERAVIRMSGGDATIDTEQAKTVIALVREHVCSAAG